MAVVFNPHSVAVGAQGATGVKSVSYGPASGGQPIVEVCDLSTVEVFTPAGGIAGTITFSDPVQADTLANKNGSLVFHGAIAAGGTEKLFTLASAETGEAGVNLSVGGPSNCTVSFGAASIVISNVP